MPTVAVERLPVATWGLGVFGFDHLQIVFRSAPDWARTRQEDWFVIEGLREVEGGGVRLAVEGWDGGTTLSEANGGLVGEDLTERIGTSESRGARVVAADGDAILLWSTLAAYAADIETQRFPYIPLSMPDSPIPIVNSSSLVASLLHHAGIRIEEALPAGLRFSPGMATLLGTSRDDVLAASDGFTTLIGGGGDDRLTGGSSRIDKLYGGNGNDVIRWSPGFNVVHGGQPGTPYQLDGFDAVDYTGGGTIRLEAPSNPQPHRRPEFIAYFRDGQDHLYSIEHLIWDGEGDRIIIGPGVGLAPAPLKLTFSGGSGIIDLSDSDGGFDISTGVDHSLRVTGSGQIPGAAGLDASGVAVVVASPFPDRFVITDPAVSLSIEAASSKDRIVLPWTPTRLAAHYDPGRQEAVIRLGSSNGEDVEVRVRGYRAGDLGVDVSRPLVLVPEWDGATLRTEPLPTAPDLIVSAGAMRFDHLPSLSLAEFGTLSAQDLELSLSASLNLLGIE